MPEISIIIPVYNNEKYLKRCIDSVLSQSFESFEVILVDDGSTDSSREICDEYTKKDNRIKVVHQINSGVSKARNVGLDLAKGNFVGFIDSDDYISHDMYEFLYNNLKNSDADISICGIMNCFFKKDGSILQRKQSCRVDSRVMSGVEAFSEAMKSQLFSVNPVNKLFRKNLFEGLQYPDNKTSEDAFLIPELLLKANKVVHDSSIKYYYVRRENSITTSNFKSDDWFVVEAYRKHLDMVIKHYPHLKRQAEFRYLWSFTYVLDKIIISDEKKYKEDYIRAKKNVQDNIFRFFINPYFSIKRKIALFVFMINKSMYKKLVCTTSQK